MAFLWFLLFSFTFTLSKSAILEDPRALLSFKNSIFDDPLNALESWNFSTTHCSWNGVACDNSTDRVIALSLPFSELSGEIPVDIGDLKFLEALELQGNNFSGKIPDQICSLKSLGLLNLSLNSLAGSVPEKLIGNGKLSAVDLSGNMLSGSISVDDSSGCEFLNHLKLSNNFLVGNIPPEIGKCKNLRTLLIDGNILEGKIPVELGRISELRVLDVSRNSFTDRIPEELAGCKKLSVAVFTNLFDDNKISSTDSYRGEFNAFEGGVPYELLLLSSLQVLWAPRANLGGRLPADWGVSCSLRVLNLGQNYLDGAIPGNIGLCKNLTFFDLSSNNLMGYLPWRLQVPCMVYFNVSKNNISGVIPRFGDGECDARVISYGGSASLLDFKDVQLAYANIPMWSSQTRLMPDGDFSILHDLSWNRFYGPLPLFSIGDQLLTTKSGCSYRLSLNNNLLNGSFNMDLVSKCEKLQSVSVNLSANQMVGDMQEALFHGCVRLKVFEAAHNQIGGSLGPDIDKLLMLQTLDLRGNKLSGSLSDHLGKLKNLTWIVLGGNNLTGEIPSDLGQLASLKVLDLSYNVFTGPIPSSLAHATKLETVLLNNNRLSGEIPLSFSFLTNLTSLDVSFNNLSGHIPNLQHPSDCISFRGNKYLYGCSDDQQHAAPDKLPTPLEVQQGQHPRKFKSFIIATIASSSVMFCMVLVVVFVTVFRKRKFSRHDSLRGNVVVTFADAPADLNYDNVVRATGGFSIQNLIGTGGFGSTYKAELAPGYHVAVKRLSIGRFHGVKQFDAEIRTLGRIRHRNLVTLIGYYFGETEMFLIYNYLSGGNLETFIQDKSGKNVQLSVIHKIAMDVAQALAYLHYSCDPRIVHRDIKPSNILLDDKLNAYLSDFGLARLLEVSETHATTDVAGTFGYVAPEYATTCRVSDKADVYSFGVVLLELLSGKKSLDPSFSEYGNGFNIVEWTKLLIKEGRPSELFSSELWEAGPKENLLGMLKLASTCTVETLSVRPTMKQVLDKLKHLRP